MVTNRFATGKKVYGNGSYRPSSGRNKPAGYIKRELLRRSKSPQRFGRDGKSDTRSGLAQAALRRVSAKKPQVKAVKKPTPKPVIQPPRTLSAFSQPVAPATAPTPPAPPAPAAPLPPAIPTVTINPNGTLDLPYDAASSADLLAQKEQANQTLLDLQASEQEQALNFSNQSRDLDIGYGEQRRETLNDAAGRGTAFSSGYGNAVGNNARDFNNMMSDLLSGNNNFKQNAERQRQGVVTNFNDFLRKEALDRAARAAAEAGKLGYGKTPVRPGTKDPGNPRKPKPKPKPKQKGKKLSVAEIRKIRRRRAAAKKKAAPKKGKR